MSVLVVDGPRPAVEWVSGLPAGWMSTTQRLVLLVLALDAFELTSAPGEGSLLDWCGLTARSTLYDALRALASPVEGVRPALIERVASRRSRTRYRLLVSGEADPASRTYGQPDPSGQADPKAPDASGQSDVSRSGDPDVNGLHTSGHTSGHRYGDGSGQADPPFPSLPLVTHLLNSTTEGPVDNSAVAPHSRTRPLRPREQEQRQRELNEETYAAIEADRVRQQEALEARIAAERGEVA